MAFTRETGLKVERVAAAGASINGGKPIRRLVAIGVKGGAAASNAEWFEDVSAATPANRRGGVSAGIGLWAWQSGLEQQLSKCFLNISAADVEVIAVYHPGGQNP